MNRSTALALASVPAAVGFAWRDYREVTRAVESHPAVAPYLPGIRREVEADWGSVAYRWIPGDVTQPALVLVHGWGKTGDSAWWPILADCGRSMVVVDLPGHGLSRLNRRFDFSLAAGAVVGAVEDSGVVRPVVVAHSMGGPVALSAFRHAGSGGFSGFVALATSAYWVRPRLRAMMAMAPYAMARRSPFLLHTQRSDLLDAPELAPHIAWAYTCRPMPRVMNEAAAALRHFDARKWKDLSLPPTTWVVSTRDSVLAPMHQVASARYFGADVVQLEAQHSMVQARHNVLDVLASA
jgi:pimeloyl-ACP methyl ester carboxylesterase